MRTVHYCNNEEEVTMHDVIWACSEFYHEFKTIPDTIKMTYGDMGNFLLSQYPTKPCAVPLERGKRYGHFVSVPGGMAELVVAELPEYRKNVPVIVVESSLVDREFEKVILNQEE